MIERRRHPRIDTAVNVRAAIASEMMMPAAVAVNMSVSGLLVSFAEPVGLRDGDRMVISIPIADGLIHALTTVIRNARGTDFRSYIAVVFDEFPNEDRDRLCEFIDGQHPPDPASN